jgi:hypothetical protein
MARTERIQRVLIVEQTNQMFPLKPSRLCVGKLQPGRFRV